MDALVRVQIPLITSQVIYPKTKTLKIPGRKMILFSNEKRTYLFPLSFVTKILVFIIFFVKKGLYFHLIYLTPFIMCSSLKKTHIFTKMMSGPGRYSTVFSSFLFIYLL